jgi:hypothetical protein
MIFSFFFMWFNSRTNIETRVGDHVEHGVAVILSRKGGGVDSILFKHGISGTICFGDGPRREGNS